MKTIPLYTRTRLLAHYDTGKFTRKEAAEHFAVSVDFVKKLLKQRKKLGHLKPLYNRAGRNTKMTQERKDALFNAIHQTPGLTLKQMRALLGGVCTDVCIHLTLKKADITYKKNVTNFRARSPACTRKARTMARPIDPIQVGKPCVC
jgi:transposase